MRHRGVGLTFADGGTLAVCQGAQGTTGATGAVGATGEGRSANWAVGRHAEEGARPLVRRERAADTARGRLEEGAVDLERTLTTPAPDEATVLAKLEVVSKAEWQVRKNRVSLLLKIRKLVGPDAWEKLQAEMGMATTRW